MPKKTGKKFTSLRGLAMSKSAKFIDKAKRPILELQSKRQFQDMISNMSSRVLDLRKAIIDDLMNVKALNLPRIISNTKEIADLKEEATNVADVYKVIFGEALAVNLKDFTVDVAADDILDAANELEDEDDE